MRPIRSRAGPAMWLASSRQRWLRILVSKCRSRSSGLTDASVRLVNRNETVPGGNLIQQGIEFDAIGRRFAYPFLRRHPGECERSVTLLTPSYP